jgi:HTH-type transcriptional repressor of NAD biosynthesis genes
MKRGLVIGKFDPLHRGHGLLIESAQAQCDVLDLVVCARRENLVPGELRAAWLRELFPAANVVVVQDFGEDDNSIRWAEYTRQALGRAPDVVFTSEDNGEAYARHLGAVHVMVDRERHKVPLSSTQVRRDPLAFWEELPPVVRAHFCKRVCLVGAESSGTTTLAKRLALHFHTLWVPEYGRDYTEVRKIDGRRIRWRTEEFVHIAQVQQANEDAMARFANRVLFCDTDALATAIWHERYLGYWSAEVEAIAGRRTYDMYFLTKPDIPFVPDRIRDSELLREWMTDRFRVELTRRGHPWLLLDGPLEQRLQTAVSMVEELMTRPADVDARP